MASTTTIPCPASIASPAFARTRTTFPGMGATTCCRPCDSAAPPCCAAIRRGSRIAAAYSWPATEIRRSPPRRLHANFEEATPIKIEYTPGATSAASAPSAAPSIATRQPIRPRVARSTLGLPPSSMVSFMPRSQSVCLQDFRERSGSRSSCSSRPSIFHRDSLHLCTYRRLVAGCAHFAPTCHSAAASDRSISPRVGMAADCQSLCALVRRANSENRPASACKSRLSENRADRENAAEKRDVRLDSADVIFVERPLAAARLLRRDRCPTRSIFRAADRIRSARSSRYRRRHPGGCPGPAGTRRVENFSRRRKEIVVRDLRRKCGIRWHARAARHPLARMAASRPPRCGSAVSPDRATSPSPSPDAPPAGACSSRENRSGVRRPPEIPRCPRSCSSPARASFTAASPIARRSSGVMIGEGASSITFW